MKKVLFLAIAALAYVSVNAQDYVYNTGSYPTANTVTTTSILELAGTTPDETIWGTNFGGVANTTQTAGSPLRMSVNGQYKFRAATSAWNSALGIAAFTDQTQIAGSMIRFIGYTDVAYTTVGGVTYSNQTNSLTTGLSDLIKSGNATDFDVTLTAANTLKGFTFQELPINYGAINPGVADVNVSSCTSAYKIPVTTVPVPAWVNAAAPGDVTIDNAIICFNNVNTSDPVITIKNNYGAAGQAVGTRYLKADLVKTGTTPVHLFNTVAHPTDEMVFEGDQTGFATNDYYKLKIFSQTVAARGGTEAQNVVFTAGVYKFTVKEVSDEVLNNADNAYTALTGLALAPAGKEVTFSILPSPTPTLKTATIK